ncbi:carbohydrate kinase family protein [Chelativorans salis]|uniref:Carbohydrate kinase family protein n=1 Tax=Chelativorans salis TaxID=2978478 RepID=A0ABT2LUF8_9HYPH|nr:carbohydrate kinase family protein [Chelativorans sp. EGI FJ00035]MCT7378165.1 carbohydrate kinase family protein [Chelativorans sp. EGI FJ00035]
MGGRSGIVTGGTWCADHNKIVEHWPGEDEVVEILTEEVRGGGSGCNLAIDLKRLDPDFPVSTIGLVGDDGDGGLLLAEARDAGIECSRLKVVPGARTNYTDAFTSKRSGRRTHLFHAGTSALLTPDHFDFSGIEARLLHLGLPGIHEQLDAPWSGEANGWVSVLRKARAAGIKTNLELCSIPAERLAGLVRPCLPYLDSLIVNDFEIAAIAGQAKAHDGDTDIEACLDAARTVLSQGAMTMVAVHFPKGAVLVTRDGDELRRPSVAVPVDAVVGANGAGDAFAAGLLYAHHEDWPLEKALVLAHATAASSLRGVGTTDAVESWRATLALADRWGWRERI